MEVGRVGREGSGQPASQPAPAARSASGPAGGRPASEGLEAGTSARPPTGRSFLSTHAVAGQVDRAAEKVGCTAIPTPNPHPHPHPDQPVRNTDGGLEANTDPIPGRQVQAEEPTFGWLRGHASLQPAAEDSSWPSSIREVERIGSNPQRVWTDHFHPRMENGPPARQATQPPSHPPILNLIPKMGG